AYFDSTEIGRPTQLDIRKAIVAIRDRKFPFPREEKGGNAGSFFKNLVLTQAEYDRLEANFRKNFSPNELARLREFRNRFQAGNGIKIPTAFLMEACGLKGCRAGRAEDNEPQPLVRLFVLMGVLRQSGYVSAAWGLLASGILATVVWRMPLGLALRSTAYGMVYGLWPIMWIVFAALWLYNLTVDTGKFDLLRRWMVEHASGDARIQVILVAFCFGALLEGTAGFGAPVAVAAFLLLGLGFSARQSATVCLIANTAPVAFGGLGIPIVALAGVTGLDLGKLSAMAGRQVPFLSLILPAYLVWVVAKGKGLRETWPAALVAGGSFALAQF